MRISIVVPAFNEEKLLGETLAQIKLAGGAFAQIGWESELIVCDNNSHDRTAEIARAAGATVVFEPVNQISRARNSGAAAATGDWLVFVDADSHPGAELFADLAKEIQSGTCFAGGATICWDQSDFITGLMMPILNIGFR
ncbi:MAG: glycosyltransferase [Verrucomicrobiae bacterium]|nr:glycosyltransferase [Verrucomicrobiae bacterium]